MGCPFLHQISAFAQELQEFVRGAPEDFAVHPNLDLALCIAVPEGHRLGEMRQLPGSNEGDSLEGREKKNAREVTCLAPSRGMREREQVKLESEIATKGDGTKLARNTRSKLQLKGGEPTTESK